MATRRTWIWIVGGVFAGGVVLLIAAAGASVYFISRHVESSASTSGAALESFDTITRAFEGRRALYELDAQERLHLTTELSTLPTSDISPSSLMVRVWNPDDERLVNVTLPLWLLRMGPDVRVSRRNDHFDLNRLELDVDELTRIGPALVLDYRNQDGVRVLLWTK